MTAVLLALGCAVLWWGPSRIEYRLAVIAQRRSGETRSIPAPLLGALGVGITVVIGGFAVGVAALMVVALVWWRRRRRQRSASAERSRDELITALTLMIAELSVGSPPARACAAAATEMARAPAGSTPITSALTVLAGRAELGGTVLDASEGHAPTDESWHRIAVAWQTSDRLGLPLADLLGSVRADLAARAAFSDRTRAGLAGPRATATVLAGLPLLGIALGEATGAQPLATLLGGGLGSVLLVIGTGLTAAGVVWSERITDKVVQP